ncbi:O-antigen ligase family protein [Micromonospora globispora]|uniref:O-antigen ligase family protein n=1 Tax=Micromonospora globispora TaxID=1450148 RepID=UPI001403897C|nr:O-antigen ligase family protein [Micromonospora globispora]
MSVPLLTVLFVVALGGRFSLDRVGLPTYGVPDLRVPGCILLVLGTLAWYARRWTRGLRRSWPPPMVLLFTALIGVQLVSALWAPPGARLGKAGWDLAVLLVLVLAAMALSADDPARAARVLLALMLAAALVYTLGAILTGPQAQGRYSAFGGGPNVFVRVVCLGIIAAVTLGAARRGWLLLMPVPLLAAAALLSGSRGGLVALVGAAVAFLVLFAPRIRLGYLIAVGAVGTLGTWAVWTLLTRVAAATTAVATTMAGNRYSISGVQQGGFSDRRMLFSWAGRLFLDHPLSGAGLDGFYATFDVSYPHNYLLALAAESGIVAVGLALAAALACWRGGRPWAAASREQIGCAVAAVYVAIASSFSGDYYDTRFLWIFAVVAVLRPTGAPSRPHRSAVDLHPAVDRPARGQLRSDRAEMS